MSENEGTVVKVKRGEGSKVQVERVEERERGKERTKGDPEPEREIKRLTTS